MCLKAPFSPPPFPRLYCMMVVRCRPLLCRVAVREAQYYYLGRYMSNQSAVVHGVSTTWVSKQGWLAISLGWWLEVRSSALRPACVIQAVRFEGFCRRLWTGKEARGVMSRGTGPVHQQTSRASLDATGQTSRIHKQLLLTNPIPVLLLQHPLLPQPFHPRPPLLPGHPAQCRSIAIKPVSYTHLTLPTKRIV